MYIPDDRAQHDRSARYRSRLDQLVEDTTDAELVRLAHLELQQIERAHAAREIALPGLPAHKRRLSRGWVQRPHVISRLAGVRFVDPDAFQREGGDLGRGLPLDERATLPTFALLLQADLDPDTLRQLEGVRLLARAGRRYAIQATREGVRALRGLGAHIDAMDLARPVQPCVGRIAAPAGLGRVHLDGNATGEGVLIGIADFRLDFHHSNLRSADGRTRLAALWDQELSALAGERAGPQNVGVVWTAEDIDRELLEGDLPYARVRHQWLLANGDSVQELHGTHVATMALGTGVATTVPHTGAAPGARLLFVNLRTELGLTDLGVRHDYALETSLLQAVSWMDGVAREGVPGAAAAGSPLVVSISLADYTGPRTGRGLPGELSRAVLDAPNRALVLAAGNGDDPSVHAAVDLAPGDTRELQLTYKAGAATGDSIELFSPGFPVAVELTAPDWDASGVPAKVQILPDATQEGTLMAGGVAKVKLAIRSTPVPTGGKDYAVSIALEGAPGVARPLAGPTAWTLRIRRGDDGGQPGTVHVYGAIGNEGHRVFDPAAEGRHTVSDLATAPEVITVGAHLAPLGDSGLRPIWSDSGRGPTREGVAKPDLATDGGNVYTSHPHPRFTVEDKALHQERVTTDLMYGTSLATPIVAGALACYMQQQGLAAGQQRDADEIKAGFLAACSLDQARMEGGVVGSEPDLRAAFGAGYLDSRKLVGPVS